MNGFFASRRRSVALLAETVALGMLAGVLLFSPLSSYAQDAANPESKFMVDQGRELKSLATQ